MFGLLNIKKKTGVTSRDVVNQIQRLVRPHKVGHAGTLDPLATGVLVVCVGAATRLVPYVQRMPKTYLATFLLGRRSDTEDIEGDVQQLEAAPVVTTEQLQAQLGRFRGDLMQRPPVYSALKVKGKRAHALARSGKAPELAPRSITIHRLRLVTFDYPTMCLEIVCSSGTYVRSLGRDIAESLGTAAVMSALERKAIGPFAVQDAIGTEGLDLDKINRAVLPASLAVASLPIVEIDQSQASELRHGREIEGQAAATAEELAAIDNDGQLVALLTHSTQGRLRPVRVFG